MKPNLTATEIALVLINRYHADRRAQDAFVSEDARKLAQVTLDAFMKNVATEIQQRYGFSLEGIAPVEGS